MMTLQARELCKPFKHHRDVLRSYGRNSPRAKARILILAMLADGQLAEPELDFLTRPNTLSRLGIDREDMIQVFYDFCEDAAQLPVDRRDCLLTENVLDQLFQEIHNPSERQALLRLIFDVIRSDGQLAANESSLFWYAVESWKFSPADTQHALHRQ